MKHRYKQCIKIKGAVHKKCNKNKLYDCIGFVWCNYCQEIVDSNMDSSDILNKEEGNV